MTIETNTPEVWVTGNETPATMLITIATGLTLAARTPLGQVTASGHFVAWAPGASDGSQIASAITAFDINTSGGAAAKQVYKSGTFNPDLVTWPGGATDLQKALAFTRSPISLQVPRI